MRLPDMLVTTLQRYIPISKEDLALLKGELTNKYLNIINSMETKNDKNAPIIKEIQACNKKLETLDPHTPEYGEELSKMERLSAKLEKKSLLEKVVCFLEKPLVRVVLMVGFLIFSRWLIKRLTEKPKEEEKDFDNDEQQQQQPQFFNQNWNPYGSQNQGGYWVQNPPPNYQHQNQRR